MPRTEYGQQLQEVQDEVLLIGSAVEKSIARSIDALRNRDLELSQQVVDEDDVIDQRVIALEERTIDVIATQQPMAGDLRSLVTALYVASELERIGDYVEGIAKISLSMGSAPPLKRLIDIPRMAEMGAEMLRRSLSALVDKDVAAAEAVWRADDEVDELYAQVYRELLSFMIEDPRTIQRATYLTNLGGDADSMGGSQSGANCRPCHQHRRACDLRHDRSHPYQSGRGRRLDPRRVEPAPRSRCRVHRRLRPMRAAPRRAHPAAPSPVAGPTPSPLPHFRPRPHPGGRRGPGGLRNLRVAVFRPARGRPGGLLDQRQRPAARQRRSR